MADDASNEDDTPPWSDPDTSVGDPSTGALVGALADRRTRNVVATLESESANVVELDDLASEVVETERESGDDRSDREEHRHQVEIDLHHRSLPKLDDAALLDYDLARTRSGIGTTPEFRRISTSLTTTRSPEVPVWRLDFAGTSR